MTDSWPACICCMAVGHGVASMPLFAQASNKLYYRCGLQQPLMNDTAAGVALILQDCPVLVRMYWICSGELKLSNNPPRGLEAHMSRCTAMHAMPKKR